MTEFINSNLGSTIVGGVIASLLLVLIYYLWNRGKQAKLIDIMERVIEHRNKGLNKKYDDADQWLMTAKQLENEAFEIAKKYSASAGAMIKSLGDVPPHDPSNMVEKYVAILSEVIIRLRRIIEKTI